MKQYRKLLALWFMRDLTDEQRRPLFYVLSERYPKTRDEQQREFSRILSASVAEALTPTGKDRPLPAPPAPEAK